MTANIIPFKPGNVPAKALAAFGGADNTLGAGILQGFAVMKYKGKVWTIQHKGASTPLMRPNNDGPMNSINVVIVGASTVVSKIFYEKGYVEGSTSAPDCFSTNGLVPAAGAVKKQSPSCKTCPMDAWGSRITDAGKQGKRCSDSKRLAIVPANADGENVNVLRNEALGGPMLLRVPAATLKALQGYGDLLKSAGYPHQAVVTRISFDAKEAYPTFLFEPVRQLTDAEIDVIAELAKSDQVQRIVAEDGGATDDAAPPVQQPAIFANPAQPVVVPQVTPQVTSPPNVVPMTATAAPAPVMPPVTTGTPPAPQPVSVNGFGAATPAAAPAQPAVQAQANNNFEAELDALIG